MRRLARVPAWAVLCALVALSTLARSIAAWEVDSPWIAPDEIIYTLLGRSFWETGKLSILGGDTGFYTLLYPAFVGLPLALDDLETGRRVLQVLQALVMSATAVPVYLWGRSLMRRRWALAAAALTLTLPSLGYSALVMSEALYLPLAVLALWALARALEQPSAARQLVLAVAVALAAATRLQALVVVPVLFTAVAAKALLDRDREVLRRFAPALALVVVAAVAVGAFARSGALGAYSVAAEGTYDAGQALRFTGYHAIGIVLLSGLVPALALASLLPRLVRRETPPATRAFVAVVLAYLPWLALEVGVFASRHVGHLAGRDLLTASPLLFLGFALWLDRGAPRPQPLASLVTFSAAAAALLLPIREFASDASLQDVLELVPFVQLAPEDRELAFAVAVAIGAAVFVLVPRRAAWLLAPLLAVTLSVGSVAAAREIERQSSLRATAIFEGNPTWVDDSGVQRVAYLYAGEPLWTGVWQHLYWNRSIAAVWDLTGDLVPGPVPQALVLPRADGTLFDASGPMRADAVVAPTNVTLFGRQAAAIRQQGTRAAGLVLWRTPGPVRVSTLSANVLANGDLIGGAAIQVYDCGEGRLELTLLGKTGHPVSLRLDGITRQVVDLRSGEIWRGAVQTHAYATEDGTCVFEIASADLVGSTRLEFVRR